MGLLRIILALLVVGSHLGATFAVKAFFINSGFYMALVIDKRYYALPISNFYASRLMRLLPTYWAVGLLTLAAEILLAPHGEKLHPMASPLAYGSGLDPTTLPLLDTLLIGWPGHALTIVLVMVTAFLLDWLIVLPIDKLRIRFGAKARIESRFFEPSSNSSTAAVSHCANGRNQRYLDDKM